MREFDEKREVLGAELKKTGMVSEIAESGGDLTATWSHNGGFNWEGKDPSFDANFATRNVSPEFGKTVGWKFIAGRDFSPDIASDATAIVLNESAAEYTGLRWWIFAAAGTGALAITLMTVSFQAVKAALMNPVKSLRSE